VQLRHVRKAQGAGNEPAGKPGKAPGKKQNLIKTPWCFLHGYPCTAADAALTLYFSGNRNFRETVK
jgi:hypothetical protein